MKTILCKTTIGILVAAAAAASMGAATPSPRIRTGGLRHLQTSRSGTSTNDESSNSSDDIAGCLECEDIYLRLPGYGSECQVQCEKSFQFDPKVERT
jgi:hypothetical protein